MQANAVADRDFGDVGSDFFNPPGYFVPQRHRQMFDLRNPIAIMRVRMTDSRSGNANQDVRGTDFWDWNVPVFQWPTDLGQLYRSHSSSSSLITSFQATSKSPALPA